MASRRQSKPDWGLGFHAKVLEHVKRVPSPPASNPHSLLPYPRRVPCPTLNSKSLNHKPQFLKPSRRMKPTPANLATEPRSPTPGQSQRVSLRIAHRRVLWMIRVWVLHEIHVWCAVWPQRASPKARNLTSGIREGQRHKGASDVKISVDKEKSVAMDICIYI